MKGRGIRDLLQLLAPFPGRLEFTLRLALICALTTLVTAVYRTPDAALTTYVVFFLNKPDRTTSLILNTAFVVIITLVIGIVFLIARAVIDEALLRVTSIALISFTLLFLASASKLQPIAGTLALIIAYALDLLGSAPTAELITRGLLYAWLFVGIPAGVSIVVNLLLAPAPRHIAEKGMAERLHCAAAVLRGSSDRERQQFQSHLDEGSTEILKAIKLAGLEHSVPKPDLAALSKAARSTTAIMLLVDMAQRESVDISEDDLRQIAATLDGMAGILDAGGYPVEISLDLPASAILTPIAARIVADLNQAITHFAEPPETPPSPTEKVAGGFFLPDAFTNPDHVRYALKTTAAAMICYLLYSLLNWPGIHTCFLTCYIVSLGTTAETVEKLTLRIMGCLLGAVLGIGALVFIVPHLESIGTLMALVFAGTVLAGWVAAGTPRISYAGFQIAFAFFLCVIQGSKPAFDLVVARDRIIGILLGNIVVYLIFTNLWPVSVRQRIDAAIAALLRQLGKIATTPNREARLLLASNGQAAIGALDQNLLIAGYEPTGVRPGGDWFAGRDRAIHEIKRLIGPLFLAAGSDPENSATAARTLSNCADNVDPTPPRASRDSITPAGPLQEKLDNTDSANDDLRGRIEMRLQELQDAFSDSSLEHRTVSHAPA